VSIRDRKDPKYDRIIREFSAVRNAHITVGVHAAEGAASDGGATVADIAEWNEFGTDRIPSRSFIGSWFDEREKRFPAAIKAEIEGAVRRGTSVTEAFQTLAVTFQADVQRRIAQGIEPANTDSTIKRKGSSTPLIDTGVLRSAILGKYESK
jgi:hypothetical protein